MLRINNWTRNWDTRYNRSLNPEQRTTAKANIPMTRVILQLEKLILWKLFKLLYSTWDTSDYWFITFQNHLNINISLISMPSDKAELVPNTARYSKVLRILVDDVTAFGDESFELYLKVLAQDLKLRARYSPYLCDWLSSYWEDGIWVPYPPEGMRWNVGGAQPALNMDQHSTIHNKLASLSSTRPYMRYRKHYIPGKEGKLYAKASKGCE